MALLLRLFSSNSSLVATIGFLFINLINGRYSSGTSFIGKPLNISFILLYSLNMFFTILSSREWNVITHILPPFFSFFIAALKAFSIETNSLFTSILIAWKISRSG